MCWKDKIKNWWSIICYLGILLFLFTLAALITAYNVTMLEKFFNDFANYISIIITTFTLAIGILIYIGNCTAMKMKYRFIELKIKDYKIIVGSSFLVVIAASYFTFKQVYLHDVLIYIVEMGGIAFFIGLFESIPESNNKKVILKMITCDEAGSTRSETKKDLVLYQITNTDYRFKDLNTKKELIIPIGQIEAIEDQD